MSLTLTLRAAEREARVWLMLWRSGVVSNFVAPVLMLLAIGIGLGELVDDGAPELDGLGYLAFVTPGLLVGTAMQSASGNSMWPVMAGFRWVGFYHAQVASPMRALDVFGGHVLWTASRATLQAVVFLAAGAALGGVMSWWGVLAIPVASLTAIAIGAPLAAFSATQDTDAGFNLIMRLVIVPLSLFSGTLFPIDQVPLLLRAIAQILPVWHGVELARAATTGSADLLPVVGHAVVLVGYGVAGMWWGARTFPRRLTA